MIFVNHSKQQIKARSYHYNSPRVYDINTYTGNNAVVVPENFRTEGNLSKGDDQRCFDLY